MHPRRVAAIALGKSAGLFSRSLGRGGGTALPGLLAQSLDADLLISLASQLSDCILVTGTNGKTTTARMIVSILRHAGLSTLHNASGSNLMRGIATALLEKADLSGRLSLASETVGLFEVDEAVLPYAIAETRPKAVVITNLFRDQLDRYGEVDSIAACWREALERLPPGANLILNGDDPLVASLGEGSGLNRIHFGIEDRDLGEASLGHAADPRYCPRCGEAYQYGLAFYGHLGHYYCPKCRLQRTRPLVRAELAELKGFWGLGLALETPLGGIQVNLSLPGIYNVHNALAAAALGSALGLPLTSLKEGLERFRAAFGRLERMEIEGRQIHLVLIKNPVGANVVLRTLFADGESKNVILFLNDRIADGRDVSWIWDVDFEMMAGRTRLLVLSGLRAEDMALRLKYAGVLEGEPLIVRDIARALRLSLERIPPGEALYILPTYTAMLEVREMLARWGHLGRYWEEE